MASIKISELESVTSLTESDALPIVNGNETKKVTIEKLGDILATKGYVAESIAELGSLGFTPIIVETLPTENISTNTIYLKLNATQGEGNVYDEYVYINDTWELIGSTSIDLSEYATKEYVDNSALPICLLTDTGGLANLVDKQPTIGTVVGNEIRDFIQDIYAKGYNKFILKFYFAGSTVTNFYGRNIELYFTISGGTVTLVNRYVLSAYSGGYTRYFVTNHMYLSSDGSLYGDNQNRLLTISYKDDLQNISKSMTVQPKLTAGSNITIDENNVISAIGGSGGSGDTSNIQEFPFIDLTEYLTYDATGNYISISTAGKTALSALFTDYYKRHNTIVGLNFIIRSNKSNPRGFTMMLLFRTEVNTGSLLFDQIMFPSDLNINYMSYIHCQITYSINDDGTITINRIGDWGSDFTNGLAKNRIRDGVLAKDNTTSFTPTADYHPSTKKYVDDAISAAITTVLEAEY